jgi:hypothetical protein
MSIIMSITSGITKGIIAGPISGILFALSMYLFANSKFVKKQTAIDLDTLLPNEKIIISKAANLIVSPKDFGLNEFAFDELLSLVGMKNKEALGEKLHFTNFRLIFKSHKINRLNGTISIFLPTIKEISCSSSFLSEKMILETYFSAISFKYLVLNNRHFW